MECKLRNIQLENINKFIVISDVHLRHPEDPLSILFLKTLYSFESKSIDAVFLLGDIFDFISVSNDYFIKKWVSIFNCFATLRAKGIAVYFIEGNHDFGFEHFLRKRENNYFNDCGDMIITFRHSKLGCVSLRHGDDIICPASYLPFRRLVKSKFFQKMAELLVPAKCADFIFSKYASLSRKKDKYRKLTFEFLSSCLKSFLFHQQKTKQMNVLIIGHIHICLLTKILKTKIIASPDWFTSPNYLLCDENGDIHRIYLPHGSATTDA
ncbi:MAG: metallophosphoesterase [Silvanigrellaceae bacterium]|nr:metallophosphoesterase [Silvanigrellaceae bacterium]